MQVNIYEATTDFDHLTQLVESKREDYITVVRDGKSVVKIVLCPF